MKRGPGFRKLSSVLHRKLNVKSQPLGPPNAAFGSVVAQQQGTDVDTVTLQVGNTATQVVGVEHLDSYLPVPGDPVYYHQVRGVPFVVGKFGPFIPPPAPPPAVSPVVPPVIPTQLFYLAWGRNGSTHPSEIWSYTSRGDSIGSVTSAVVLVNRGRSVVQTQRWAAMSAACCAAFMALIGYDETAGFETVQIYALPGLALTGTITLTGTSSSTSSQGSICWDPFSLVLYVYDEVAGTLTSYDETGTLITGPVTVSSTIAGSPFPVLSTTADGFVWLIDNANNVGVWTTGTLTSVGEIAAVDPLVAFVALGDGSYDVAGGGDGINNPGPLYTVSPGSLTATEIVSADVSDYAMCCVVNGILYALIVTGPGAFALATYNVATATALSAVAILPDATEFFGLTLAADNQTGMALGYDANNGELLVQPFTADGNVGVEVVLADGPPAGSGEVAMMILASPYASPSGGFVIE